MPKESVDDFTSSSLQYPGMQEKRAAYSQVSKNGPNPGGQQDMVIWVTKNTRVDETAADGKGPNLINPPAHTLLPTNQARVWNDSQV
ncbi:hypothetical protein RRF57_000739 [Xylaria bambusicola]|uniref:Uncharacterized protein n=1 Tax=Xylaria bambusicola TaxID=326684 RepID=A0AAN7UB89_9PEZI